MSNLTIISDGTAAGTRVQVGDEFLSGITRIEFDPIVQGGSVRAKITVDVAALRLALSTADIECSDAVTADKIREALLLSGRE